MKRYHLNCGTLHGFGLPTAGGTGGFFKRGHGVIHCLLFETSEGLVLVDTGWGTQDCIHPSPRVQQFMKFMHCPGQLAETAFEQIKALGFCSSDVKHIFLTHLHLDHAGGLPDFPAARVHIFEDEITAALHPRTLMEKWAYQPEHWKHHPRWQVHRFQGDQWFGLDCLPPVRIAEFTFVMIPFVGHTRGHCGVAIQQTHKWLLHCGDVYAYHSQVNPWQSYRYPGGRLMETFVTAGFRMPRSHWTTIKSLLRKHSGQIQTVCSHDAHEFMLMRETTH